MFVGKILAEEMREENGVEPVNFFEPWLQRATLHTSL